MGVMIPHKVLSHHSSLPLVPLTHTQRLMLGFGISLHLMKVNIYKLKELRTWNHITYELGNDLGLHQAPVLTCVMGLDCSPRRPRGQSHGQGSTDTKGLIQVQAGMNFLIMTALWQWAGISQGSFSRCQLITCQEPSRDQVTFEFSSHWGVLCFQGSPDILTKEPGHFQAQGKILGFSISCISTMNTDKLTSLQGATLLF